MGDGGKFQHTLAPQETGDIAADPAHGGSIKITRFAQAGNHHSLGGDAPHGVEHGDFAQLALDLPVGDEGRYRAIQGPVNRSGTSGRLGHTLEQIDHQRRRGEVGYVAGGYFHCGWHGSSPMRLFCRVFRWRDYPALPVATQPAAILDAKNGAFPFSVGSRICRIVRISRMCNSMLVTLSNRAARRLLFA